MYDIIGDIHGHAEPLIALLKKLGYSNSEGVYQHPSRKVIFLGDFIDRGPKQRQVLDIVMSMVQQSKALAVMGNHEFNAIAYHTEHPRGSGQWLRPRTNKNSYQHLAFLNEYLGNSNADSLTEVLHFFQSLPLWLDLPDLRVIHACWSPRHINYIAPSLGQNNTLTDEMIVRSNTTDSIELNAIETLLKGVEIELPEDAYFYDKDGTQRSEVRVEWWRNEHTTLGDACIPKDCVDQKTGERPLLLEEIPGYADTEKPVFFGHYWMQGVPGVLTHNTCCLDYSIAKEGKLVAYRWDGKKNLASQNIVWVGD